MHRCLFVCSSYLKEQSTVFLQSYSLSISQCQQLVIIHDRVHILDPQRIHITIEHNILALVLLGRFVDFTEDTRQQTIRPITCYGVECTVQLDDRAGLGIHDEQLGLCAKTKQQQQQQNIKLVSYTQSYFLSNHLSFIIIYNYFTLAYRVCACARVLITTVLPPPVGPTIIVVWRVNIVSYIWTTLSA